MHKSAGLELKIDKNRKQPISAFHRLAMRDLWRATNTENQTQSAAHRTHGLLHLLLCICNRTLRTPTMPTDSPTVHWKTANDEATAVMLTWLPLLRASLLLSSAALFTLIRLMDYYKRADMLLFMFYFCFFLVFVFVFNFVIAIF